MKQFLQLINNNFSIDSIIFDGECTKFASFSFLFINIFTSNKFKIKKKRLNWKIGLKLFSMYVLIQTPLFNSLHTSYWMRSWLSFTCLLPKRSANWLNRGSLQSYDFDKNPWPTCSKRSFDLTVAILTKLKKIIQDSGVYKYSMFSINLKSRIGTSSCQRNVNMYTFFASARCTNYTWFVCRSLYTWYTVHFVSYVQLRPFENGLFFECPFIGS